ncbi:helix-turn-helix domain containing protein [Enterococcus larvae]|uniref:helix-turn-helix domain-containing protein n=1 Tax=Enterococcus larvae TaxID=2794352 RepID=UPI001FD8694C|nr:helix-turn-helix domain containing protein [Enterococcus larvae]
MILLLEKGLIFIQSSLLQLVTENKLQRQLKLLATLRQSHYPISFEELAEEFQVNSKTIRQDVEQLLALIPSQQELFEETTIGTFIQPVDSSTIQLLFNTLNTEVLSFKVLDLLFIRPAVTLDELEDLCFVSEATLKRHLLKLKKSLKKYSLTLTTSPVQLVGTEENIRYFYFQYFYHSETIRVSFRPEIAHQKSVAYLSMCLEEKLHLKILLDHKRLSYWQMVQKIRIKNGFHYEAARIQAEEIFFPKKYRLFKIIYLDIQKRFYPESIGFSENELIFSYATSLDCIVYKDYLFGNPDFSFKSQMLQENLSKITSEVAKHLSTNVQEAPAFFKALQNYFAVHLFLNKVTPLFQKNDSQMIHFIRHEHSATFGKWMYLLSTSAAFHSLEIEYFEDICANLTIYTVIYLYEEKTETKKVLFALNGDNVFLDYLLLIINRTFSGIHTLFLLNKTINSDFLAKSQADIIISNYPIYIENPRHSISQYVLKPIPTMEDWQKVRRFLAGILSDDEFE